MPITRYQGGENMKIGERIRLEREKKGLTQDELAKMLGHKSRSAVHKIEQKESLPTKTLQKIADALGISLAQLMGLNDEIQFKIDYNENDKERYEKIKSELEKVLIERNDAEYYENNEVKKIAQEISENRALRSLLDVQADMSEEELVTMLTIARALKKKETE